MYGRRCLRCVTSYTTSAQSKYDSTCPRVIHETFRVRSASYTDASNVSRDESMSGKSNCSLCALYTDSPYATSTAKHRSQITITTPVSFTQLQVSSKVQSPYHSRSLNLRGELVKIVYRELWKVRPSPDSRHKVNGGIRILCTKHV